MKRIHGPRVKQGKHPHLMKRAVRYFHEITMIYFSNRGNLLARGIAYSLLVTIVPTLFLALYVGSVVFTNSPALQSTVDTQISQILPVTYAAQVMEMVYDFMSSGQWKSMGIIGISMLVITPSFLFAAIERALSMVMSPPVERRFVVRQLFYFLTQLLTMILLFGVAFVSVWVRKVGAYFDTPEFLLLLSSKGSTVFIMGITLAVIYRVSYHNSINRKVLYPISFLLAFIWQLFSSSGSAIVAVTSQNQVMYGVMAGAIILLLLAYIFAVLLLIGGVIIGKESKRIDKLGNRWR